MNKYNLLFLPAACCLLNSCSNNSNTKDNSSRDTRSAEHNTHNEDTALVKHTDNKTGSVIPAGDTAAFINRSNLKTEDFILQYPGSDKASFRRYIESLRKEWQNTPNPIIATYEGNDFGDYMHILFKDAKGITYDFGQAENNYGQYKLHETSGQYEDNPAYLKRKFAVYWEWKPAEFSCCEGEYNKAKAYLPSITKLELLKN